MTQTHDAPDFATLLQTVTTEPGTLSAAYSAFWNYSIGNQLLALGQLTERGIPLGPIASFHGWKDHGRHVSKGAKALQLCMPITCKRENENGEAEHYTRFVYRRNWFALAQTEGADYAAPPPPAWDKTRALAALDVTEIPFDLMNGNIHGYAKERAVSVSPLGDHQLKTLFHEVAHVLLGHTAEGQLTSGEQTPRSLREVEAEATAMLCCAALGLPGLDESRGYVQHWYGAGNPIPDASARKILKTADAILKAGRPAASTQEGA